MTDTKTSILADLDPNKSRAVTPADDGRHPATPGDPWWGETMWWVAVDPTTGFGMWIYLLTRPNLGVASLGLWIWDASAMEPWRIPYSKHFVHLQLPDGHDLRDLTLNGHDFSIRCIEPLHAYEIHFDDTAEAGFDLRFESVAPPQPMGINDTAGHWDQPMWATGIVRIGDRAIPIDTAAFRDRTWSTRPETAPGHPNCYTWATAKDTSFQLLSMFTEAGDPLHSGGYLMLNGEAAPLQSVTRTVTERGEDHRPLAITVELIDQLGRTATALGRCVSAVAITGFVGHLTFASVVEWDIDGQKVNGEDHDSWPYAVLRRRLGG